jgi:hypothetical protein
VEVLWLRIGWALLPVVAGPALADALDERSRPVQLTASITVWAAWAAVLLATLVPRTATLTVVRVAGPAALVAAAAAAVAGPAGGDDAVALALAATVAVAALASATADAFADGSSYGDERRFALRVPAALVLGPVPAAWALAVAAPAAAGLLLAARAWVAGALVGVAAAAAAPLAWRALHRLSRRWLVLVPAGLVVHDHVRMPEPVLLPRSLLAAIGPAPADAAEGDGTADLTLGALGLVVAIRLREPIEVHRGDEKAPADRLLVAPGRPGAFLATARERRLPA